MQKYNWNYPTSIWAGENRIRDLSAACKQLNINKPLLVTDNGLAKSKIILDTLTMLKNEKLQVDIYSNVVGNPTGANVDEVRLCGAAGSDQAHEFQQQKPHGANSVQHAEARHHHWTHAKLCSAKERERASERSRVAVLNRY